jgi:large subunit ribosomal protein L30
MSNLLRITQIRSTIDRPEKHKRTVRALGLRRLYTSVTHKDTPQIRGMVRQVQHLVRVEEIEGEEA